MNGLIDETPNIRPGASASQVGESQSHLTLDQVTTTDSLHKGFSQMPLQNKNSDMASALSNISSTIHSTVESINFNWSDGHKDMEIKAYADSLSGKIVYYLLHLNSCLLVALLLLLYLDIYMDCQLKGFDTLCFSGNYFITGSSTQNGYYYFVLWIICFCWYFMWIVCNEKMRNIFRIPTSNLIHADFVYIWKRDTRVDMGQNIKVNPIVKPFKKLFNMFTSEKSMTGHSKTVPIETTEHGYRYFVFDAQRYIMDEGSGTFYFPSKQPLGTTSENIRDNLKTGLSTSAVDYLTNFFGRNEILFNSSSATELITSETYAFFTFYQVILYLWWFWFNYLIVAAFEFSTVVLSICMSIYLKWKNEQTVLELTKSKSEIEVLRNGNWETIPSTLLVPGDIVRIFKQNWTIPCELIILSGKALMNESSLTGEAMPLQKKEIPEHSIAFTSKAIVKHTLFSGTQLIHAMDRNKDECTCIVLGTGINTSKGSLVKNIITPEKVKFQSEEELEVVFAGLIIYGMICGLLAIGCIQISGQNLPWLYYVAYAIFTMSQVLTPLLPLSLKVGQIRASTRIKSHKINCIDPGRIAIAGKVRVFCFDKTGTLTKEGLDFTGVVPCKDKQLGDLQTFGPETPENLTHAMATCHAVTSFNNTFVGNQVEVNMFTATEWELNDRTSDVSVTSPDKKTSIDLVKRFEFDHGKQLMSVVVEEKVASKKLDTNYTVYTKGSFEKVLNLCDPKSVPDDYTKRAKHYAMQGGYVLAIATRQYKKDGPMLRENIEEVEQFQLIGLIMFRNEPKPEAKGAIIELKEGDCRPVMITGDNAQCGKYISHECGLIGANDDILLCEQNRRTKKLEWVFMSDESDKPQKYTTEEVITAIQSYDPLQTANNEEMKKLMSPDSCEYLVSKTKKSHVSQYGYSTVELEGVTNDDKKQHLTGNLELAVTGNDALQYLQDSEDWEKLLFNIRIYARMSPESKIAAVTKYRNAPGGLIVGMCGDGGNDCGALRAAQVGVALSDAEASIVSPFTSQTKRVDSVVQILREGRSALHTSFAVLKFFLVYGNGFVLLKLLCFSFGVLICTMDLFFIDVFALLGLSFCMTFGTPESKLAPSRPTASLFSARQMFSSCISIGLVWACMLTGIGYIFLNPNYVAWPAHIGNGANWWTRGDNWETTTIFITFYLMLIQSTFTLSTGYKYRKNMLRNVTLIIYAAGLYLLVAISFLLPLNAVGNLFHFATDDFNGPNTTSETWATYQKEGNPPSAGMSFIFRLGLVLICVAYGLINFFIQIIAIEGRLGEKIAEKYPSKRLKFSC